MNQWTSTQANHRTVFTDQMFAAPRNDGFTPFPIVRQHCAPTLGYLYSQYRYWQDEARRTDTTEEARTQAREKAQEGAHSYNRERDRTTDPHLLQRSPPLKVPDAA